MTCLFATEFFFCVYISKKFPLLEVGLATGSFFLCLTLVAIALGVKKCRTPRREQVVPVQNEVNPTDGTFYSGVEYNTVTLDTLTTMSDQFHLLLLRITIVIMNETSIELMVLNIKIANECTLQKLSSRKYFIEFTV